jgi:hypothetical protein
LTIAQRFRVCVKTNLFTPKAFDNLAQGNTLGLEGLGPYAESVEYDPSKKTLN